MTVESSALREPPVQPLTSPLSLNEIMPIFRLDQNIAFPAPHLAHPSGLLAVGGDLSEDRLLLAYSLGIFPWYEDGQPLLWHAPDPRMVLEPSRIHISRSMTKIMRRGDFEIRYDTDFAGVIRGCASASRPGQDGTWITDEMLEAYIRLHTLGYAHSAEAWVEGELAGGLYGISLGGAFFGESMFARRSNASKVAFVSLMASLSSWGIDLVDCQVHTELLEAFGAEMWPRARFTEALKTCMAKETRRGPWSAGPSPKPS